MPKGMLWCKGVGLALFLCAAVGVSTAAAETVQEFQAEYVIQPDGQVIVTEEISYDFAAGDRHGIFRTLRKDHPQGASAWYKERYLDIEIQSVLRNGDAVPYTISDGRSTLEVRIGDPDRTVTGLQDYTIHYTVDGGMSSTPQEGGEFYWNVTGAEWSVPLERVQATVVGVQSELLADAYACYQGVSGTTQECATATATDATRQFTATDIPPGEGVTIAVAVSDGVAVQSTERWSMMWPLLLGAIVWIVGLGIWIWRYRTQDDPDHPVVPQYEPYADYLPMYTGVLFDGQLHPRDITAGIIYLAEQGFLRIERTEETVLWLFETTDHKLTWRRPLAEVPTTFLQQVATLLFSETVTPGQSTYISELEKRTVQNRTIIRALQKSVRQDLEDSGFMARTVTVRQIIWSLLPGVFLVGLTWWHWSTDTSQVLGMVVVTALVNVTGMIAVLVLLQPCRTARGYEARLHIKGFREFLRVTDTERFKFHNAPEKNPQTFMEYLPYAIALGVEKEWAEVFSDITIPEPEWYQGGSAGNFSAVALTNDLGKFSSSFASSSGASASSGGGSAGGGAGGGGGGSW